MSKTRKPFTLTDDELIELRVPKTVVFAYGKIKFMAGAKGECWPTMKTLAKLFGLKSVRQARRVVAELVYYRLITVRAGKYHEPNRYSPLAPDLEWIKAALTDRTRMSGLAGHGCPVLDRTRMSARKESSSEKKNRKEESAFATATVKPPPPPPNPPPPSGGAEPTKKQTSNATPSKGFDDDDPNQTPEQRFAARLLERHGVSVDAVDTTSKVKNVLAHYPYIGATFADFLGFDKVNTTGKRFTNPVGHYLRLAQKFCGQLEAQRAQAHMAEAANATGNADIPRDAKGRCARCGGGGMLKDRSYCDCPMGRDLAHVAKRKPKSEAKTIRNDYTVM